MLLLTSEERLQRIGRCLLLLLTSEERLQRTCGCRLFLLLLFEQFQQQDNQKNFLQLQFAIEQSFQRRIVLADTGSVQTTGVFDQLSGIDGAVGFLVETVNIICVQFLCDFVQFFFADITAENLS